MLKMQACACSLCSPMAIRKLSQSRLRGFTTVVALTAAVTLSACYVVPIDARTGQPIGSVLQPAVQSSPGPLTLPVRLYPANELAARYGVINASVTNDLHGKGSFNAGINGEAFAGEATRQANSPRSGIASGAGNRGSYLSCEYTMNSSAQGTGTCKLSDGAQFTMHIGN